MRLLLDKIPYSILVILAAMLLLAPFYPMPHVMEKLIMLARGELHRPVDIFDLFYHLAPLVVLLMKWTLDPRRQKKRARR